MSRTFDFVMTEHPAWRVAGEGFHRIFLTHRGGRHVLLTRGRELTRRPLDSLSDEPVVPDTFTMPKNALTEVPELATALRGLGRVARFRNGDLWDAIGTAIIRQVIRAAQSKKLYRAFCEAYGERIEPPGGETYAFFPQPEIVLKLTNEQFSRIGMAFKCRPLRAAAEAFLEYGPAWRGLAPRELVDALQVVPRIGPWTAHAAVADWSNDWAFYPYDDLAVRTWAKRAAPTYDWPTDDAAFGRAWRALASDHLSSLTLLTLAWGSQHGDIG